MKRLFILFLVIVGFWGCATTQTQTIPKERPFPREYAGCSYDEVWRGALLAAQDMMFAIQHSDKESGIITATRQASGLDRMMFGNRDAQDTQISIMLTRNESSILVDVRVGRADNWGMSMKKFAACLDFQILEK